jgi:hypothetical protein
VYFLMYSCGGGTAQFDRRVVCGFLTTYGCESLFIGLKRQLNATGWIQVSSNENFRSDGRLPRNLDGLKKSHLECPSKRRRRPAVMLEVAM